MTRSIVRFPYSPPERYAIPGSVTIRCVCFAAVSVPTERCGVATA